MDTTKKFSALLLLSLIQGVACQPQAELTSEEGVTDWFWERTRTIYDECYDTTPQDPQCVENYFRTEVVPAFRALRGGVPADLLSHYLDGDGSDFLIAAHQADDLLSDYYYTAERLAFQQRTEDEVLRRILQGQPLDQVPFRALFTNAGSAYDTALGLSLNLFTLEGTLGFHTNNAQSHVTPSRLPQAKIFDIYDFNPQSRYIHHILLSWMEEVGRATSFEVHSEFIEMGFQPHVMEFRVKGLCTDGCFLNSQLQAQRHPFEPTPKAACDTRGTLRSNPDGELVRCTAHGWMNPTCGNGCPIAATTSGFRTGHANNSTSVNLCASTGSVAPGWDLGSCSRCEWDQWGGKWKLDSSFVVTQNYNPDSLENGPYYVCEDASNF